MSAATATTNTRRANLHRPAATRTRAISGARTPVHIRHAHTQIVDLSRSEVTSERASSYSRSVGLWRKPARGYATRFDLCYRARVRDRNRRRRRPRPEPLTRAFSRTPPASRQTAVSGCPQTGFSRTPPATPTARQSMLSRARAALTRPGAPLSAHPVFYYSGAQ